MSVKFEKETIKQTGGTAASVLKGGKHDLADEIGTALTGGKGNIGAKGYLAVSDEALVAVWYCAYILLYRPTSTNCGQILCEQRCSHLVHSPEHKNSWPRGSRRIVTRMDTISLRASLKWLHTELSSVRQWVIF